MKINQKMTLAASILLSGLSTQAQASNIEAVCPNPVVIQTDWFPTPERAVVYELAGADGEIDAQNGRYIGQLKGSKLKIEIRVGGPYVGFSSPTSLMYQDQSILLGMVQTDQAVENYSRQPTISVMAGLDINPQILMFDPSQYDFKSISDIGKSDAQVLYFEGLPFMEYLTSNNILKKEQIDASFDGSPARFITSGGKIVIQGYASNEPYRYENDIRRWKKPVSYLLINDAGYEIYPENLAARPEAIEQYKSCFTQLVPKLQQALVDYVKSPEQTNNTLIKLSKALKVPVPLTEAGNDYAVKTMLDLNLMSNGHNETIGDFEQARVERVIFEQLSPMFEKRGKPIDPAIKAEQIHTNEFIDFSIGL